MFKVNSPGKDNCFIGIHSIRDGFIPRHVRIARKERGPFQCVTGCKLPDPTLMHIIHQIEPPRHAQNGAKPAQDGNPCAGLDRTGMDEVRLEFLHEASEVQNKSWQFAPAKWLTSSLPDHLLHMFRDGAILHLSLVALQLHKKGLMPVSRYGFEETMIMGGIAEGEIYNFQSSRFQFFGILRAQICPSQFLTILEIMQCLRAKNVLDLVRLDRANRRGTQYIDHVASEGFTKIDVTRRTQAAPLHNGSILLILCDEFIRGAQRAFEQTCLF